MRTILKKLQSTILKRSLKHSFFIAAPLTFSHIIVSKYIINEDLFMLGYYIAILFVVLLWLLYTKLSDFEKIENFMHDMAFNREVKTPQLRLHFGMQNLNNAINTFSNVWQKNKFTLSQKVIEQKFIFDTIPNGIIILNDKLIIQKTNDAAHDFLGASIVNNHISNFIEDKNFLGMLHLCLHEKRGKRLEVSIETEIMRVFNVKIEPMHFSSSHELSILLVMDDITEIFKTEKSFSDFVTNASHEIRTPLAGIIGISETLLSNPGDNEAYQTFIPMVQVQANRIKQIIDDLLSLASIERQLKSRPSQIIDLSAVFDDIAKQCEWDLSQHQNNLKILISHSIPKIIGDYNQLIQVFYNLVSNAIKYGKDGSDITIDVTLVSSMPHKFGVPVDSDKYLAISVKDKGDGIEPKYLSRLTERFFRIDSSRSKKITGTGLGLSIVLQIINRHAGFLDIKSTVGEGSEFIVYLPVYKEVVNA